MLDIVPAAAAGEGDPPPALRLPRLRGGGGAGARAGAADHRRDGDRGPAGARAGGQVRRLPAACTARPRSSPARGSGSTAPRCATRSAGPAGGCEPLWRLLRRHVMASTRIFADDTLLPVFDPGRGRTKTGRLWGYAIDDRPWGGTTPPAVVSSTPRTARASTRPPTWPGSRACCRWTATGGSSACSRTDHRARSVSPSAGRTAGGASMRFTGPPARRWPRRRCAGSASSTGSRRRSAAGQPMSEGRSGRSEARPIVEALHAWLTAQLGRVSGNSSLARRSATPCALARAGAVPGGRPARAGYQHRRAGDPWPIPGAQECLVRRLRRRRPATGQSVASLVATRETQRGRAPRRG